MNKMSRVLTEKSFFYATLFSAAVILAFLAPGAAVNVDEQLHYSHAKDVVNWYFTGGKDISCLHTPETNLKYYGQSVDNFTALFNRVFNVENEFLVRHYTGAFFFLLLLFFTGILAQKLSGSWVFATFSIISLIFMPRLAGQAFGNLKDIPFAAGYIAGLLMIISFIKELPRPRWRIAIMLGLAFAFTVSVRAGGFILFAYLILALFFMFVIKPVYIKQIVSDKLMLLRFLSQGLAILFIGYFAGLLFWPFALQNVFVNPLESLGVMEHYKISIRQLFEGKMIWSTELPWYYLPKWLLISTPIFGLIGLFLFMGFFLKGIIANNSLSRKFLLESFIAFAFAFPIFYVIAIGSNLYSGVRQMLFVLPLLSLLATLGIFKLLKLIAIKKRILLYPFSFLFFLLLLFPLNHQIITFPVDYVYFNALAGGNKMAWGNYEYDYYFHGMREPSEYLIDLAGDNNVTVAMNCNLSNYFDDRPNITFQYTRFLERSSYDWDYGLFGLNYIHPYMLKNNLWQPAEILKIFFHKGNPITVLVKRKDKTDFHGISEINNGNFKTGIRLIELALENDPYNVWLYVHLATARLAEGESDYLGHILQKGKEIHPFYEPFFLLEARQLYEAGKYKESLQKLTNLFEINPWYQPAEQLYKEVSSKLN